MLQRLTVPMRVIPRSRSDRVEAPRAGRLVLRVAAPPEGRREPRGQALLARALGLRSADVQLERGGTSRDKSLSLPITSRRGLERLLK